MVASRGYPISMSVNCDQSNPSLLKPEYSYAAGLEVASKRASCDSRRHRKGCSAVPIFRREGRTAAKAIGSSDPKSSERARRQEPQPSHARRAGCHHWLGLPESKVRRRRRHTRVGRPVWRARGVDESCGTGTGSRRSFNAQHPTASGLCGFHLWDSARHPRGPTFFEPLGEECPIGPCERWQSRELSAFGRQLLSRNLALEASHILCGHCNQGRAHRANGRRGQTCPE